MSKPAIALLAILQICATVAQAEDATSPPLVDETNGSVAHNMLTDQTNDEHGNWSKSERATAAASLACFNKELLPKVRPKAGQQGLVRMMARAQAKGMREAAEDRIARMTERHNELTGGPPNCASSIVRKLVRCQWDMFKHGERAPACNGESMARWMTIVVDELQELRKPFAQRPIDP